MRCLLLILAIMSAAVTLASQPQTRDDHTRETERFLLDAPEAPYKLTARGKIVSFCNRSPVKVTGFRLGCVERKDGELSVWRELEFVEDELPAAGETITCMSWGSVSGFPLTGCSKGPFAVIEVKLEDGATWKLNP